MGRELQSIDYTTKDYEGFRQLMLDKIPSLTPEWTDTSSSDFGIVLLELLAFCLDILSYYQDKTLNESMLSTAKTKEFVIKLCRFLGYELSQQVASQHKIKFTKKSSYLDTIIKIPKGTQISTDSKKGSPVVFETDEELTIASGESTGEVLATQGITVANDTIGTGDGSQNQKVSLTYPDVLWDTLQVKTYESGIEQPWTKVEDFLSSESTSRHYKCSTDYKNKTYIECGNGVSGRVFPINAIIRALYRVGGGVIGNVGVNTITTFASNPIEGIESLTNPYEATIEGVDPEDIEVAKVNAPRYYRTSNRAVTSRDFEDLSCAFTGISKAKCVETFNENGDLNIYVLSDSYTAPTQQLKDDLLDYLNQRRLSNNILHIYDVTLNNEDIEVNVTAKSNYLNSDIKTRVEAKLWNVFGCASRELGQGLKISEIIAQVVAVEGVDDIEIVSPVSSITESSTEILNLVNVTANVTGGM